jgi:hypothetical protein
MTTAGFEPATSNGEEQNDRAAAYRGRGAAAPWGVGNPHLVQHVRPFLVLVHLEADKIFVLKAQYVKNVFVPGEGSNLPTPSGDPRHAVSSVCSPCGDPLRMRRKRATKNPVLRTGLVNGAAGATRYRFRSLFGQGFSSKPWKR